MRLKYITSLPLIGLMMAVPATAQDQSGAGQAQQQGGRNVVVAPYIEVSQIALAELSPGDDFVTYTQVAVGVDAAITGQNNGGSISLRYERNISYDDDGLDNDTISGVARGYATIVPQALTFEAGGVASRTSVDSSGASTSNPAANDDSQSQIYSVYAGPNLQTRAGDVHINGLARVGYTKIDTSSGFDGFDDNGTGGLDVFDDSVTYEGELRAGTIAGEVLPVGVGLGGGFYQEDISNLDQRVRDYHVRADVTVPVTQTLNVVGGIGYENVEVSSRDVLRDINGDPVLDGNGRFLTDNSGPRQLAYDVDGIIWDVGVVWSPTERTSLAATVGRRYGSTTYYGNFAWTPSNRSALNISVYDEVSGFGGNITGSLADLPTEFTAGRNALTGDFNGCVSGDSGAGCLGGTLGSIRSGAFRGRGAQASYTRSLGNRYSATVAAGYDRRSFFAAQGTILAAANGLVDESYYLSTSLSGTLGRNAGFTISSYANWFDSDFNNGQSVTALGSSASYNHSITSRLSARAAVAVDYLDSDVSSEDITAASGLVGLRYDF